MAGAAVVLLDVVDAVDVVALAADAAALLVAPRVERR